MIATSTSGTTWTWSLLTHMTAFMAGACVAVAFVIIGIILLVQSLPYYIAPLGDRRAFLFPPGHPAHAGFTTPSVTSNPSTDEASNGHHAQHDPHLGKAGWVRMSFEPLDEDELLVGDNMDASFGPSTTIWNGPNSSSQAFDSGNMQRTQSVVRKIKSTAAVRISSLKGTVRSALSTAGALGSFLAARFMGDPAAPVPSTLSSLSKQESSQSLDTSIPKPAEQPSSTEPRQKWQNLYGVLRHKSLLLYTDDSMIECIQIVLMPQHRVVMFPFGIPDSEMYLRKNPIALMPRKSNPSKSMRSMASSAEIFLYAPTGFDKEDWFFMLRRASKLPAFADPGALSAFYQELDPMRAYTQAMQKLIQNTVKPSESSDSDDIHSHDQSMTIPPELQTTAWLNALVGRMFVAIHANPYIKNWIIHRLMRRTTHQHVSTSSFLGDIVIQDINVGTSLPVLSNPKLLNISVTGDMDIEMDIDYTGGVRVEVATVASVSVPAWDAYMRPITVPIVVAVKINRFSARLLIKIKPYWETNRIWFGFYRQPELILQLEVQPVISNKLIKINMVNQVIEKRIKEALEESVMLPNMDDLSFWPFQDLLGMSPYSGNESDEDDELDQDDEQSDDGNWNDDVHPDEKEIQYHVGRGVSADRLIDRTMSQQDLRADLDNADATCTDSLLELHRESTAHAERPKPGVLPQTRSATAIASMATDAYLSVAPSNQSISHFTNTSHKSRQRSKSISVDHRINSLFRNATNFTEPASNTNDFLSASSRLFEHDHQHRHRNMPIRLSASINIPRSAPISPLIRSTRRHLSPLTQQHDASTMLTQSLTSSMHRMASRSSLSGQSIITSHVPDLIPNYIQSSKHARQQSTSSMVSIQSEDPVHEAIVLASLAGEAVESTLVHRRNRQSRQQLRHQYKSGISGIGHDVDVMAESRSSGLMGSRMLPADIVDQIYADRVAEVVITDDDSSSINGDGDNTRSRKHVELDAQQNTSTNRQVQDSPIEQISTKLSPQKLSPESFVDSPSSSTTSSQAQQPSTSQNASSYVEYLGNVAFRLGTFARQYGLDRAAASVATSVAAYSQPAITYAHQKSTSYQNYVKKTATNIGLKAIDQLGLTPDKHDDASQATTTGGLKKMLGDSNVVEARDGNPQKRRDRASSFQHQRTQNDQLERQAISISDTTSDPYDDRQYLSEDANLLGAIHESSSGLHPPNVIESVQNQLLNMPVNRQRASSLRSRPSHRDINNSDSNFYMQQLDASSTSSNRSAPSISISSDQDGDLHDRGVSTNTTATDPQRPPSLNASTTSLRQKSSLVFSMLGLSITTSAPPPPVADDSPVYSNDSDSTNVGGSKSTVRRKKSRVHDLKTPTTPTSQSIQSAQTAQDANQSHEQYRRRLSTTTTLSTASASSPMSSTRSSAPLSSTDTQRMPPPLPPTHAHYASSRKLSQDALNSDIPSQRVNRIPSLSITQYDNVNPPARNNPSSPIRQTPIVTLSPPAQDANQNFGPSSRQSPDYDDTL